MITDVVEDVHATVLRQVRGPLRAPSTVIGASTRSRTGAIPGLVYRSIRKGYDAVGAGLRIQRKILEPRAGEVAASVPERERALAILNGVWGHHLAGSKNPLAIEMSFRHEGVPLTLEAGAISAAIGAPGSKLLVLVHGLCMNDLVWRHEGHDHGAQLASDLGYTPVYLHYNSGLHISTNGKRFAELLERLAREWPVPLEELAVIGHSMGGLVARSAVFYAEQEGYGWRSQLRRIVFLGTPHHGSGLERAGSRAEWLLGVTPFSAAFRRIGASRSEGITDLRHGSVVDADWQGADPLLHRHDIRCIVPLPDDVEWYALAGTLGANDDDVRGRLLGDGFVPLNSALGIHKEPDRDMAIPPSRCWVGCETSHLDLLRSPEVYAKLHEWLAA